jgi:hypothetical protein
MGYVEIRFFSRKYDIEEVWEIFSVLGMYPDAIYTSQDVEGAMDLEIP